MGNDSIIIGKNLRETTPLFRYISFSQFISLVESRTIYLTRISKWEDPWEGAFEKLPVRYKNTDDFTEPIIKEEEFHYGQCWTSNEESDALWRIYSPNREGLIIKTSVKKFRTIGSIKKALIDEVKYTDEYVDGYDGIKAFLIKRKAFEHEKEIRLIARWYDIMHMEDLQVLDEECDFINLEFDPFDFIEGVIIDPRASRWFADCVIKYCNRAGFRFEPVKSDLYETNIFEKLKVQRHVIRTFIDSKGQEFVFDNDNKLVPYINNKHENEHN